MIGLAVYAGALGVLWGVSVAAIGDAYGLPWWIELLMLVGGWSLVVILIILSKGIGA